MADGGIPSDLSPPVFVLASLIICIHASCYLVTAIQNGLLTPPIPQATITELIRIDREVEPLIVTLAIYIPVDYVLLSYPITPPTL
jgi:hypothetical protein